MNHEQTLERYRKFWNREPVDRPIVGFGIPYPAKHLRYSRELQQNSAGPITPDMVSVEQCLPSYEELFELRSSLPGDIFYTAEPLEGFPWVEAMLGCGVVASGQGFSALHCVENIDELERVPLDLDTPWARKYFEFLDVLGKNFEGRCGVGQPIFRGISDLLAALMTPEKLIFALYDEPDRMKRFIRRAIGFYLLLYREQISRIKPFRGGYQIGFYDIWCPEPCVWLQDDNLVLFSEEMYGEFFMEFICEVTSLTPYNMIHMHPVSLRHIDHLMDVETLGVIEVNREMTARSFPELIADFQRIQRRKLLDIQGTFTVDDLKAVLENLSPTGLQLKLLVEDFDDVPKLYDAFQQMTR